MAKSITAIEMNEMADKITNVLRAEIDKSQIAEKKQALNDLFSKRLADKNIPCNYMRGYSPESAEQIETFLVDIDTDITFNNYLKKQE